MSQAAYDVSKHISKFLVPQTSTHQSFTVHYMIKEQLYRHEHDMNTEYQHNG